MDIILGHHGTDFDCLASIVAAGKLHPGAVCVLPRGVDRSVHQFLGLYRDAFDLRQARYVDADAVRRIIVVDTRRVARLGPLGELIGKPGIEVILYDHHPALEGDIVPTRAVTEPLGATVTLLLRELRARDAFITDTEATLYALGIYEDTGNLTYSSTTVDDVLCVAYCLENGADLDVVNRFVRYDMSEEQRAVMNQFVLSAEHHDIHGVKIALAMAEVADYVGDVAALTNKLTLIESVDAVFTLASMKKAVYLVGRSRSDAVDAGTVLEGFGGGGHHRAASAVVRGLTVEEVRAELLLRLQGAIAPPPVAAEIMSAPVRTINHDATVNEGYNLLVRHGYGGVPVVEDGRMVGVISRKDIDVARMHGLGHAPVRGYMSRRVITAAPNTPGPELQALLFTHGVGQIPIMDGAQLVGIVSRADLRRALHGARMHQGAGGTGWCGIERLDQLMEERLSAETLDVLRQIGRVGDACGVPVFLIGGAVRDLLLDIPNLDIDVVVEGDGVELAERLAEAFSGKCSVHTRFGTATVRLDGGWKIDVASARTEHYVRPAALPSVEFAGLKDDLYRRDFTMNAMAVQLNLDAFGRLIDYFGGRGDLEDGLVRVLHNLSFIDDPTRIFRAIRFEQRYRFTMESQTEALLQYALESQFLDSLSSDRIRDELVLLLSEPDPVPAIHRMAHLLVLEHIHRHLAFDEAVLEELHRTTRIIDWIADLDPPVAFDRWAVYLIPLLRDMTPSEVRGLARRLHFTQRVIDALSQAREAADMVLAALSAEPDLKPSQVYDLLCDMPAESIVHLIVRAGEGSIAERHLGAYLTTHRHVRLVVAGADLLSAGFAPGPGYGRVLRQVLTEKLDGAIAGPEQERQRLFELAEASIPRRGRPPSRQKAGG